MLTSSFIQIPGVGQKTERRIWEKGVLSWDHFVNHQPRLNLPQNKVAKIRDCLAVCTEHLKEEDAHFFAELLPKSELWRLYPEFRHRVAFVDIETTGLSPYYNNITLVGLFNGRNYHAYIANHNLSTFQKDIKKYSLIVTFNGSLFDIPFLKKKFPDFAVPAHIDLRFFLRRLGYSGSLKAVEKNLGIKRASEIKDLNGFESTILWNKYIHGNIDALRLLIEYNKADVINLQTLMETGYELMQRRLLPKNAEIIKHVKFTTEHDPKVQTVIRKVRNSQIEVRVDRKMYLVTIPKREKRTIQPLIRKLGGSEEAPAVVGIDLSASEKKASGWALLQGDCAQTRLIKTDKELVAETIKAKPRIISIDSPLSIPGGNGTGKLSRSEARRTFGIMRQCERTLRHRGIYVYPCLIPSMKPLTERGMRLAKEFTNLGFEVIESYPGAAQDILGIVRKRIDIRELKQGLLDFGIIGDFDNGTINHDKLDAVTSALVAYFYLTDNYEALGNEKEGYLIIPKAKY